MINKPKQPGLTPLQNTLVKRQMTPRKGQVTGMGLGKIKSTPMPDKPPFLRGIHNLR